MALDTKERRLAALRAGLPIPITLPEPDGSIAEEDRRHLVGLIGEGAGGGSDPGVSNKGRRLALLRYGHPTPTTLPEADGEISAGDRLHLLGLIPEVDFPASTGSLTIPSFGVFGVGDQPSLATGAMVMASPAIQAVATQPFAAGAILSLAAADLDAVAAQPFASDGALILAVPQIDGAAEAPILGAGTLTLGVARIDAEEAFAGQGRLTLQAMGLDAAAFSYLANGELVLQAVDLEAVAFNVPAGVGALDLAALQLLNVGQMHVEALGELNASAFAVVTLEALGEVEVEPEPSTDFWTPRVFSETTTWVTQ